MLFAGIPREAMLENGRSPRVAPSPCPCFKLDHFYAAVGYFPGYANDAIVKGTQIGPKKRGVQKKVF